MKNGINRLVFVFLLLVMSSGMVLAQSCPSGKTAFVWVNGILVGNEKVNGIIVKTGAQAWAEKVDTIKTNFLASKPSLKPECVVFVAVYNTSEKWKKDFLQSTGQWLSQEFDEMLSSINSLLSWLGIPDKFISSLKKSNFLVQLADPDLITLFENVRDWSMKGYRVVLVGHSQGAYYTNAVYETIRSGTLVVPGINTLPDSNKLVIVNIASAAGYVADGRNKYITQCGDIILNVPNSLPANVNNTSVPCLIAVPPGSALHYLNESYLSVGLKTQKQIYQHLEELLPPSPPPSPTLTASCSASPGIINAGQSTTFSGTSSGGIGKRTGVWSGVISGANSSATYSSSSSASAGFANATYTVSDSSSPKKTATANCSVQINAPVLRPFSVSCSLNPNPANMGQTVTGTISQSGGVAPITYTQNGASTNGTFYYSTSSAGTITAQVVAKDSKGRTASNSCSATVVVPLPPFSISCSISPRSAKLGNIFYGTIYQSGGVAPISYTQNGASTNKNFSYKPTRVGSITAQVRGTDGKGRVASSSCSATVTK